MCVDKSVIFFDSIRPQVTASHDSNTYIVTLTSLNARRIFIVIFFRHGMNEKTCVGVLSVGWISNFWIQMNKRPKTTRLPSVVLLMLCGSTQEQMISMNEKRQREKEGNNNNSTNNNQPATMTTATTTKCRLDSRITSLGMGSNSYT